MAIIAARQICDENVPTGYTPIYRIEKGGVDITGHFNDRCVQLRVDYSADDDDTALFTLDDRDWAIARPSVGDRLKIYLGYAEVGMAYMGDFEVAELHFTWSPKAIMMKCSSTGQRSLLKSQTTQNLENKTIGEIASIIAERAGVSAEVGSSVSEINIGMRNVTQSPLQVLSELKRHFSLIAKFIDGKLVVVGRDEGMSASDAIVPILVFQQEHFSSGDIKHTEAAAYSSVKAAYVDPQDYITKFVEHAMPNVADGLGNLPFVPGRNFNNKQEAEAAAKAQAQALTRARGEADLQLAKGDPWIRDQMRFLIRGMRDGINGSYVTDLVSHIYLKDQGILTSIKGKPDSNGANYESLFDEATPDFLRQNFLVPGAGGLIGSLFTLGGRDASQAGRLGATAADLINGIDPFK